jgi:biopolymer transport protein ExbB
MSNIAEALVATAVGLIVAIPAVFAFNTFQRLVKTTLANTDALSHILLSHLRAEEHGGRREAAVAEEGNSKGERSSRAPQARGTVRRREEAEGEGGAR